MIPADRLSEILAKPHATSALVVLHESPGISPARLARLMGANQASTGRVMVDHLARFALVSVKKVPGPFRKTASAVALTPGGEKLAAGLKRLADLAEELPQRRK